jgi:hypothetical protein
VKVLWVIYGVCCAITVGLIVVLILLFTSISAQ